MGIRIQLSARSLSEVKSIHQQPGTKIAPTKFLEPFCLEGKEAVLVEKQELGRCIASKNGAVYNQLNIGSGGYTTYNWSKCPNTYTKT